MEEGGNNIVNVSGTSAFLEAKLNIVDASALTRLAITGALRLSFTSSRSWMTSERVIDSNFLLPQTGN